MKKLLKSKFTATIAIVVLMIFTLASCGGPSNSDVKGAILTKVGINGDTYYADDTTLNDLEITNEWMEERNGQELFWYEYSVTFHHSDEMIQRMHLPDHQKTDSAKGQIVLVKRGDRWVHH